MGKTKQLIGYVSLAITAAIIVAICAQIDNWQRDWTTNFAETDPASADPDLRPLPLDLARNEVAAQVSDWVSGQSGWDIANEESSGEQTRLHLTRTTSVFRFVDDIHVTITDAQRDEADGSVMTATSQSRVGKGDLGQNPRNLKQLLSAAKQW